MADVVKASVGFAVAAALVLAALTIAFTLVQPGDVPARQVFVPQEDDDGSAGDAALLLSALDGPGVQSAHGVIAVDGDGRVIVLKVPIEDLRAAAKEHGYNTGQHALAHPDETGVALLAYSADSTHLGCRVDLLRLDDGALPYVLIDVCHQGLWDPLDLATPQHGTAAPTPLDVMRIELRPLESGTGIFVRQQIPQDRDREADHVGDGAPFRLMP